MPKWITAIFVFFLSTTLLTAKAITVEDVIRKHVEVMAAASGNEHKDKQVFADYSRKGYKATLEGIETVDGKPCYKIFFDLETCNKLHYLIDAKSWYVIRRSESAIGKPLLISTGDNRNRAGSVRSSRVTGKANN